jgi:hypothetical protein
MISRTADELNSLSSNKKLSTRGKTRIRPQMVQRDPARNVVAEEVAATR